MTVKDIVDFSTIMESIDKEIAELEAVVNPSVATEISEENLSDEEKKEREFANFFASAPKRTLITEQYLTNNGFRKFLSNMPVDELITLYVNLGEVEMHPSIHPSVKKELDMYIQGLIDEKKATETTQPF